MRAGRLIFLGPPGTGKGTQAQRLSQKLGWTALSSGDVLRREIRGGTSEIGRQARAFVEMGKLVPDEIVTGIMLACIRDLPQGIGYLLDGFPRTLPQAESLDAGLKAMGATIDGVVDFRMDDSLIVRRIVGRRVCTKCGASYNTEFLPPKVAGICDQCGEPLTQRVDDREDVIVTRLKEYREQTAPLVEYYARKGLLRTVDAAAAAQAVEADVFRIAESLGQGR